MVHNFGYDIKGKDGLLSNPAVFVMMKLSPWQLVMLLMMMMMRKAWRLGSPCTSLDESPMT